LDVDFEESPQYLTAHLRGTYSLDGMLGVIDRMADECRKRGADRLLVDVSISGDAPLPDRYVYAQHAASALAFLEKCAAYTGPEQRVEIFTEMVARNRGLKLRVFGDSQQAIGWLAPGH